MALVSEFLPVHPRRASAGRRRRHRTQLAYRVARIVPGAATILLTPVWSDAKGPMEQVFLARALSPDGQPLRLPQGGSRDIAALMQSAFPRADWQRAQTWHADTNQLTAWGQASRAFRETAAAGFVEDVDTWHTRTTTKTKGDL